MALDFDDALSDGALPRLVAAFEETDESDRVALYVETGEERATLLELVWRDESGLEEAATLERRPAGLDARTDHHLTADRRGLNAAADARTGRYAKGDVVGQLAHDLRGEQGRAAAEASRALVVIERPRPVPARASDGSDRSGDSGPRLPEAPRVADIETQRANVMELLISGLMEAMQRELTGC